MKRRFVLQNHEIHYQWSPFATQKRCVYVIEFFFNFKLVLIRGFGPTVDFYLIILFNYKKIAAYTFKQKIRPLHYKYEYS